MGDHAGGRAVGGGNQGSDRVGPNYARVSRAALLAGASAFALAALGASGVARAGCVPSLQTISEPITGPIVSNGGAITVTGSGEISGYAGVDADACAITKLTIKPGGTVLGGELTGSGVSNANTITTLTNKGTIGGFTGVNNELSASTITTLTNSGKISSFRGMVNNGEITTLTNRGKISAFRLGTGIVNNGRAITTLTNSGPVSSDAYGVYNNGGTITTLTNTGTISGYDAGVINFGFGKGMITTLTNSGTISGVDNVGAIVTLNNRGTLGDVSNQRHDHDPDQQREDQRRAARACRTSATIATLTNTGTIRRAGRSAAAAVAAVFNSGTITTLTNSGTISGGAVGDTAA